MHDEKAFLRAISDAPPGDSVRLVYADWLDDGGDHARATALRLDAEVAVTLPAGLFDVAWGAKLPAPEDRHPPALRRLTEAANGLPVDWLIAATWLGREVRSLGERFDACVPPFRPVPRRPLRDAGWREIVARIGRDFVAFVGEAVVRERFLIPADYALFAAAVGGLTWPDEDRRMAFDALFPPEGMADLTRSHCEMWAEMHGSGEHLAACGLWLFVGYRDKHDFHLCCDRASPLYGVVVDMHDSHPWIAPPGPWLPGPSPHEVEARSFLGFLRRGVAEAENEGEQ